MIVAKGSTVVMFEPQCWENEMPANTPISLCICAVRLIFAELCLFSSDGHQQFRYAQADLSL